MTRIHPLLGLALLVMACAREPEPPVSSAAAESQDDRPMAGAADDDAARVVARALTAAGGLAHWRSFRDATFISTLTLFDDAGNPASETIFLHKLLLRSPVLTRLESIGLPDELVFGFDGRVDWMLQNGHALTDPANTAFTRFHAFASSFWFSLPFALTDPALQLTYLGEESRGDRHWRKLRVEGGATTPLPVDWVVIYFDDDQGLIDRVHVQVRAEFLAHKLWIGKWRDYREVDGVQRERRRLFYPADRDGRILGIIGAEQLVEHVRFDNDWPEQLFQRPLSAGGGSPAG